MKKGSRFLAILAITISVSSFQFSYSQTKTPDELKAERDAIRSEYKSKDAQDRQKKIEKLKEPDQCGIESVDNLALKSAQMLVSTKSNNLVIPDMYKRVIGETLDGVTEVTTKKPSLEEVTVLLTGIVGQIDAVIQSQKAVQQASEDAKKATAMQAVKAAKTLNFTKDVLSLLAPELELSKKVVSHLITTIKSSKNY